MRLFSTLLLILLIASLSGRAAEPAQDVAKRAKMRIESLLGNRRGASSTPVSPANPFVLPQSGQAPVETPNPTNETPPTKSAALNRLAATLNVSGYIVIKDVPHLIINRQTYRQNDNIPVRDAGGSVSFLVLKTITETDFTLELDGAELTQKHTVK